MQRVLPILTLALAVATFAVLGTTRDQDTAALEDTAGKINRIEDQLRAANASVEEMNTALTGLDERCQALSEKVEESIKPLEPPSDETIAGRVGAIMDRKWGEFLAKSLLAQGRIGVIQPSDNRTIRNISRRLKPEIERLGVRGDSETKVTRIAAETIVLHGRARAVLRSDKAALAVERRRLLDEAGKRLGKVLREYQLKRVMEILGGRMEGGR